MKATSEKDSRNMSENEKRFREIVPKYCKTDDPKNKMYSYHLFFDNGDAWMKKEWICFFYFHYFDKKNNKWLEYEFNSIDELLDPNHPYNILPDGRTVYQYLKDMDFNVNLDFESSVKYNEI